MGQRGPPARRKVGIPASGATASCPSRGGPLAAAPCVAATRGGNRQPLQQRNGTPDDSTQQTTSSARATVSTRTSQQPQPSGTLPSSQYERVQSRSHSPAPPLSPTRSRSPTPARTRRDQYTGSDSEVDEESAPALKRALQETRLQLRESNGVSLKLPERFCTND